MTNGTVDLMAPSVATVNNHNHMAEFPELGKHCFVCERLDYLPFPCEYCHQVFCKEHKATECHNCLEKTTSLSKLPSLVSGVAVKEKRQCAFCNSRVNLQAELVKCSYCQLTHCLQHRHPEGHKCNVAKSEEICEHKPLVGPIITSEPFKGCKGSKNEKLAQKVAVMKLKHTAKGVVSIPHEERVYLCVEYNSKKKPFYVSKEWTVGKCVDWLCKELGVDACKSNQQQSTSSKLCLRKNEQTLPCEMFVKELEMQNVLSSGDNLTLTIECLT